MKFDTSKKVLVIGRAGMDIYPEPPGTKIDDVQNFSTHLGGSAANTCVTLSKLNVASDLVTCVSDDAIGNYIFKNLMILTLVINSVEGLIKNFKLR